MGDPEVPRIRMRAVGHRDLQSVERVARPAITNSPPPGPIVEPPTEMLSPTVIFGLPPGPAGSAPPIEGIWSQSTSP